MCHYGVEKHYYCDQIDLIIRKWSFNKRYSYLGYAMLADEKNYNFFAKNKPFTYQKIRQDIANYKFKGDVSFTCCDILYESYFQVGLADVVSRKGDLSYSSCLFKCHELNLYKIRTYKFMKS